MAPDRRFATPVEDNVHFNHRAKFTQVEIDQIVALVAACSQGGTATKVYKLFKKATVTSPGIESQGNKKYVDVEYHGVFLDGSDASVFKDSVSIP
ncbi:hypothetical protein PG988_007581 [Apiospora saccharicola]